jgi:uncharacterized protein YjiS (DUF1127 family)
MSFTYERTIKPPIRALTAITRFVSRWRAWESHRRNLEMLAHDDGMLADIGLSRADALAAGNQPCWREPRKWLAARAAERQAMQERIKKFLRARDIGAVSKLSGR